MGAVLRRVVLPLLTIGLFARWLYLGLAAAIQENCRPDCISDGEVTAALVMFLVALALSIAAAAWSIARRRRDGS